MKAEKSRTTKRPLPKQDAPKHVGSLTGSHTLDQASRHTRHTTRGWSWKGGAK